MSQRNDNLLLSIQWWEISLLPFWISLTSELDPNWIIYLNTESLTGVSFETETTNNWCAAPEFGGNTRHPYYWLIVVSSIYYKPLTMVITIITRSIHQNHSTMEWNFFFQCQVRHRRTTLQYHESLSPHKFPLRVIEARVESFHFAHATYWIARRMQNSMKPYASHEHLLFGSHCRLDATRHNATFHSSNNNHWIASTWFTNNYSSMAYWTITIATAATEDGTLSGKYLLQL